MSKIIQVGCDVSMILVVHLSLFIKVFKQISLSWTGMRVITGEGHTWDMSR